MENKQKLTILSEGFTPLIVDGRNKGWKISEDYQHYDELQELVRQVHNNVGDILPHDSVYEAVVEVFFCLEGFDDWEDALHEIADSQVSIYNYDLKQWLVDFPNADGYMQRAVDELGTPEDFIQQIQWAQYIYYMDIVTTVIQAIEDLEIEE